MQKTKLDLQKRIVIVGHFAARKLGIRSLKKGCVITQTIKDNTDTQLLVKLYQLKALAIIKELGITDFKATLHL